MAIIPPPHPPTPPCGRQYIGSAFVSLHSGPFVVVTLFLCPLSLLLVSFSIYWFSLVHFVCLSDPPPPPPTLSCCSSVWRGADPSPGQVPGADGEPESEASRLRLQTALRGLLTEVTACLSLISPPTHTVRQQQDELDVAKLFTKDTQSSLNVLTLDHHWHIHCFKCLKGKKKPSLQTMNLKVSIIVLKLDKQLLSLFDLVC